MRDNNLKLEYLSDVLFSQKHLIKDILSKDNILEVFSSRIEMIQLLNQTFPSYNAAEKYSLLYLLSKAYFREENEKVQLVWSGPEVSGLPGRDTEILMNELIDEAKHSIVLSVYSMSGYAKELISLLKRKAMQGLFIEIYINDFTAKKEYFQELLEIKNKKIFLYEYTGAQNATQALHAKVISIDDKKSLITSSNLSYNGMEGNLEIGVVINSIERAKEIRAVFSALLVKHYFKRIK